jgi:hypothetical protein
LNDDRIRELYKSGVLVRDPSIGPNPLRE